VPDSPDVIAPDGSTVHVLLSLESGGMARFSLAPRTTTVAVRHRTVEEIWYVVAGSGEMWRSATGEVGAAPVSLEVGVCVTIPLGTHFQFRSASDGLVTVAVTMPPWPGEGEAIRTTGPWEPTVQPGPGLAEA
jgi:mannose-6-phosphate isomerase-like protein (cupin superfamily)